MARKLNTQEERRLVEKVMGPEFLSDEENFLDSLSDKRDAILWMSPESRAFFDKDSKQFFSKW